MFLLLAYTSNAPCLRVLHGPRHIIVWLKHVHKIFCRSSSAPPHSCQHRRVQRPNSVYYARARSCRQFKYSHQVIGMPFFFFSISNSIVDNITLMRARHGTCWKDFIRRRTAQGKERNAAPRVETYVTIIPSHYSCWTT